MIEGGEDAKIDSFIMDRFFCSLTIHCSAITFSFWNLYLDWENRNSLIRPQSTLPIVLLLSNSKQSGEKNEVLTDNLTDTNSLFHDTSSLTPSRSNRLLVS